MATPQWAAGVPSKNYYEGPDRDLVGVSFKGTHFAQLATVALDQALRAVRVALFREGLRDLKLAIQRTPKDTGALRNSARVTTPEELNAQSGPVIELQMGFGGPAGAGNILVGGGGNLEDVGYAVYVHEDLTAHHEVGEAKFLEKTILEELSGMETRMAGDMTKVLG